MIDVSRFHNESRGVRVRGMGGIKRSSLVEVVMNEKHMKL